MKWLIRFLVSRLKEKSTIGTVVTGVFGAFGINAFPELKDGIVAVMAAIVSLIAILTRERESEE